MNFAAYQRKSIYSDKSDSIENQARMCREYAQFKFAGKIDHYEDYQDEGFTGADTNRPALKRLMEDIAGGLIDVLIVYQIDRLSRSVRDFANIYSLLKEKNVTFVSVKESFETNTPIGDGMVYMSTVFAQMERENIQARVTDNMLGLAKRGFWTGGNPPYGYVRKHIVIDGKKHCTIEPDPEAAKYVEWIFDTFLQMGISIQSMETRFKKDGVRTVNGCFFYRQQIYRILTMPYCVPASQRIRDYFIAMGCMVEGSEEEWDGSHGVIIYGRTNAKTKRHTLNPREDWIVCVGMHQPFISEEKWLAVQEQFHKNKFNKKQKYPIPLLKGVLRCAKCGTLMQVARKKLVDSVSAHYYCQKRMRQGAEACDTRSIKADILDNKVIEIFKAIDLDESVIRNYVSEEVAVDPERDIQALSRKLSAASAKIERLTASLAEADGSSAQKYIIAEIERQDIAIAALRRELESAKAAKRKAEAQNLDIESKTEEIKKFVRDFENLSASERNAVVREVVKECRWDGETLYLKL